MRQAAADLGFSLPGTPDLLLTAVAAGIVVAAVAIGWAVGKWAGPPLAGFWGKLSLFMSGLQITQSQFEQGGHNGIAMAFLVLLIVGALNAAIAAAYYLRLVSIMFFQPAVEPVPAGGGLGALVAATRPIRKAADTGHG